MKKLLIYILMFVCPYSFLAAQHPSAIKAYNSGLAYYNARDYEQAIPFFEEAIKKDEKFLYAYRTLISCHEQRDELKQTIPYYERAIALDPSNKKVVYNFALTYLSLKDYNKCRLYLQKALEIDPIYIKAKDKLAEINTYLESKEDKGGTAVQTVEITNRSSLSKQIYNEALQAYKNKDYAKALKKLNSFIGRSENPDFYYLKAIAYQQVGERDKAIEAYLETIETDDRHFDANLNLGTIYYNDNNFEDAALYLETAYARRKNDRDLLYSLAKAQYFAKNYEEAMPLLEQYLEYDRKNGEAWYYLAEAYSKNNLERKAEKAYAQAKELSGGSGDRIDKKLQNAVAEYGNKAKEASDNGDYEQAIEILEKAITEHSKEASLRFNLGLNYMEVGNINKAKAEFKKTIDLESSHAKAYQALGLIHYEKGEFSEAAAYYLATIEAGKQDAFVHYKLGSCYFKLKRFAQAIESYKKAIELNQEEKYFYFSLGLAYLYNKNNYKSIETLEHCLKLDPSFLDAQYHICVNYIETNQYQKCIEEGEKLVEKNPQYAKAYLVIGHAYKRLGKYTVAERYQQKAERLDPSLR